MKTFSEFLSEGFKTVHDKDGLDEIVAAVKQLGNQPVIYRGFKAKQMIPFLDVTNDRADDVFRGVAMSGGTDKNVRLEILKRLGVKKPIFATRDVDRAAFFGGASKSFAFIVVPKNSRIDAIWSSEIKDLNFYEGDIQDWKIDGAFRSWASGKYKFEGEELEKEIDRVVKTYKKYSANDNFGNNEIILTMDDYYLVSPELLYSFVLKKSKFKKFNSPDDIKTYSDLAAAIEDYRKFHNYMKRDLDKKYQI